MKILVTGSTGKLGSALIKQLMGPSYEVTATSRTKPEGLEHASWVYSDLLTGEGLEEAVKDAEVIIHAATSPLKHAKQIEVSGLERFLSKMPQVKHFIYPSIVGIEEIPFKYYKLKYEAEEIVKNSGIPYSIVRATQFHEFVDNLLLSRTYFNTYIIPGSIKFQTVDTDDFANHLIGLISRGPQGRTDDFGGPEVMTLKEMAELKIRSNNESNKVLSLPLPGNLYKALLNGKNTNLKQKNGKKTFQQYLSDKKVAETTD